MEKMVIGNLENLVEAFSGTGLNADRLQYFKEIDLVDFLEALENVLEEEVTIRDGAENVTKIIKVHSVEVGIKTDVYKKLDLSKILDLSNYIIKKVLRDVKFGNMLKLRQAYLVKEIVNYILDDYEFITEPDRKLLYQEVPNVNFVVASIKNRGKIDFNGQSDITIKLLLDCLEELKIYFYEDEKNGNGMIIKGGKNV